MPTLPFEEFPGDPCRRMGPLGYGLGLGEHPAIHRNHLYAIYDTLGRLVYGVCDQATDQECDLPPEQLTQALHVISPAAAKAWTILAQSVVPTDQALARALRDALYAQAPRRLSRVPLLLKRWHELQRS